MPWFTKLQAGEELVIRAGEEIKVTVSSSKPWAYATKRKTGGPNEPITLAVGTAAAAKET